MDSKIHQDLIESFSESDQKALLRLTRNFRKNFDTGKLNRIEFGKQDERGSESITLVDHEGIVKGQEFFNNPDELLGYLRGFMARDNPVFKELEKGGNKHD